MNRLLTCCIPLFPSVREAGGGADLLPGARLGQLGFCDLVVRGQVSLEALATHRFPLEQAGAALETAATYQDGVVRAMVLPTPSIDDTVYRTG